LRVVNGGFRPFGRRKNSLNQNATLDTGFGKFESFFGIVEDVVPEESFVIALQFWDVDVRPGPTAN